MAITLVDLAALAGAIYLVVLYLVYTAGPKDIFKKFRRALGVRTINVHDERGDLMGEEEESDGSFWADVFTCHRCATPYVTAVILLLWLLFPPAVYLMAVMGAAVWLAEQGRAD